MGSPAVEFGALLGGLALLAAFFIACGVILTDRAVDLGKKSWLGPLCFVLGWGGIAALSAFKADPDEQAVVTEKWPAGTFVAVAVMLFAMSAQQTMLKSRDSNKHMGAFFMFALAWVGYAIAMGFREGTFNAGTFGFAIFGAIVIPASMLMLLKDRKFDLGSGKPIATQGSTYGFGLPAFALGWVSIAMSISYMDTHFH